MAESAAAEEAERFICFAFDGDAEADWVAEADLICIQMDKGAVGGSRINLN